MYNLPIELLKMVPKNKQDKFLDVLFKWINKKYRIAHRNGVLDGLRMYAHWKDGVQYVGTTGTTLQEAIEKLES